MELLILQALESRGMLPIYYTKRHILKYLGTLIVLYGERSKQKLFD